MRSSILSIEDARVYAGQIRRSWEADRQRARVYMREAVRMKNEAIREGDLDTAGFWERIEQQQRDEIAYLNSMLRD